jgi:hypothetical protein
MRKMTPETFELAFILLAGTLAFAILAREAHVWWLDRHERKSLKAIKQMEGRYYRDMKADAVKYVEELYSSGKGERP